MFGLSANGGIRWAQRLGADGSSRQIELRLGEGTQLGDGVLRRDIRRGRSGIGDEKDIAREAEIPIGISAIADAALSVVAPLLAAAFADRFEDPAGALSS